MVNRFIIWIAKNSGPLGIKLHLNMLLNDGGLACQVAPSRPLSETTEDTKEKGWLDPGVEGDFLRMILRVECHPGLCAGTHTPK